MAIDGLDRVNLAVLLPEMSAAEVARLRAAAGNVESVRLPEDTFRWDWWPEMLVACWCDQEHATHVVRRHEQLVGTAHALTEAFESAAAAIVDWSHESHDPRVHRAAAGLDNPASPRRGQSSSSGIAEPVDRS